MKGEDNEEEILASTNDGMKRLEDLERCPICDGIEPSVGTFIVYNPTDCPIQSITRFCFCGGNMGGK